MTAKAIYEKFKDIFGYLSANVVSYKEINSDNHSIRITMKNGTTYIFTYPPNGCYKLEVEMIRSHGPLYKFLTEGSLKNTKENE